VPPLLFLGLVARLNDESKVIEALQRAFSKKRIDLFTSAASSPTVRNAWAMTLWNGRVSAALWTEIGWTEVIVRNALHRELALLSQRQIGTREWFNNLDRLGIPGPKVDKALAELDRRGKPHTEAYVVAGLSLGFWGQISAKGDASSLWLRQLHRAFPGQPHAEVAKAMKTVHELRNRIAHHRPICKGRPEANIASLLDATNAMRTLIAWTAPEVASLLKTPGLEELINSRP
jgi:hypothetical protein